MPAPARRIPSRYAARHRHRRITVRRIPSLLAALIVVAATLLPVPVAVGANATVTGTVTAKGDVSLSGNAILIVAIVDQQAAPEAGAIIGFQRVNNVTLPAPFEIKYNDSDVDPDHSYAAYASVTDGSTLLQSVEPVPVITGGPTSGVGITVSPPGPSVSATVTGTITRTDKSSLSPNAVALAVLINATTGTL